MEIINPKVLEAIRKITHKIKPKKTKKRFKSHTFDYKEGEKPLLY